MSTDPQHESVMKGGGYYSAHSAVQHAAAAPGFPMLERAAAEVPLPASGTGLTLADFGCAGGANELTPIGLAIAGLRARDANLPIEVVLADLPGNDWASLFARVETSPQSYAAGLTNVYSFGAGRSLFGPVVPDRRLTLSWTAITVHWLSAMPPCAPNSSYSNLVTGPARAVLQARSGEDWRRFLEERARETIPGGQVVVVGGASLPDGTSGAEGLFRLIDAELVDLAVRGAIRESERAKIFYPTWNRTPDEFIGPVDGSGFRLAEQRADATSDSDRYPQFARDGNATAFATAYLPFVRAITEPSFFRWIEPDRSDEQRAAIVSGFYAGLQARIAADPAAATCRWHTVSLRLVRT